MDFALIGVSLQRLICPLCLIFLLQNSPAIGQADSSRQMPSLTIVEPLDQQVGGSFAGSSAQPLLSRGELRLLLLGSAAVLLIAQVDRDIDSEYAIEQEGFPYTGLRPFGKIGRFYDTPGAYVLLGGYAVSAVGYSLITHDRQPARTVAMMLESWGISALATWALKVSLGRHRPYLDDGPYRFDSFNFNGGSARKSFPSGHTSSIFAMMTVAAKRAASPWIKVAAYTFAGSVAVQRVLDREHWASDVLAGAGIGFLAGSMVVRRHSATSPGMRITPLTNGRQVMLAIQF